MPRSCLTQPPTTLETGPERTKAVPPWTGPNGPASARDWSGLPTFHPGQTVGSGSPALNSHPISRQALAGRLFALLARRARSSRSLVIE